MVFLSSFLTSLTSHELKTKQSMIYFHIGKIENITLTLFIVYLIGSLENIFVFIFLKSTSILPCRHIFTFYRFIGQGALHKIENSTCSIDFSYQFTIFITIIRFFIMCQVLNLRYRIHEKKILNNLGNVLVLKSIVNHFYMDLSTVHIMYVYLSFSSVLAPIPKYCPLYLNLCLITVQLLCTRIMSCDKFLVLHTACLVHMPR